jgi:hypothetical protein
MGILSPSGTICKFGNSVTWEAETAVVYGAALTPTGQQHQATAG